MDISNSTNSSIEGGPSMFEQAQTTFHAGDGLPIHIVDTSCENNQTCHRVWYSKIEKTGVSNQTRIFHHIQATPIDYDFRSSSTDTTSSHHRRSKVQNTDDSITEKSGDNCTVDTCLRTWKTKPTRTSVTWEPRNLGKAWLMRCPISTQIRAINSPMRGSTAWTLTPALTQLLEQQGTCGIMSIRAPTHLEKKSHSWIHARRRLLKSVKHDLIFRTDGKWCLVERKEAHVKAFLDISIKSFFRKE